MTFCQSKKNIVYVRKLWIFHLSRSYKGEVQRYMRRLNFIRWKILFISSLLLTVKTVDKQFVWIYLKLERQKDFFIFKSSKEKKYYEIFKVSSSERERERKIARVTKRNHSRVKDNEEVTLKRWKLCGDWVKTNKW